MSLRFLYDLKKWLIVVTSMVFFLLFMNVSEAFEAEKENSGWSFYFDNDFFALGDRDNDYTGGMALKLAGTRVKSSWLSVDKLLGKVNDFTAFNNFFKAEEFFTTHSMEMGFTLFTPENLESTEPIHDQHPYASLFFINNTRMVIVPEEYLTYQSTLTIGLLGLPLAGKLQKTIHSILDADEPNGWGNQISAGGEPTFKYSVSRSRNYVIDATGPYQLELKTSTEANIGFSTDMGMSVSMRLGSIQTPWWSFNPHNSEYISLGSPVVATSNKDKIESYLWLGGSVKYRFYNAFLQGQFRDSEVTYNRDELNPIIVELWLGYTHGFEQQWQLSGFIRARNNEIDLATVDSPVWGGFIINKAF